MSSARVSCVHHSSVYLGCLILVSLIVAQADAGFSTEVCDSMDPTDTASIDARPVFKENPADESPYIINLVSKPYYRANSKIVGEFICL